MFSGSNVLSSIYLFGFGGKKRGDTERRPVTFNMCCFDGKRLQMGQTFGKAFRRRSIGSLYDGPAAETGALRERERLERL